jgi:hypothetical protein
MIVGMLVSGVALPLFAQTNVNEMEQLTQRVAQLEKEVRQLSKVVEPLKAQQAADSRRKTLRENFDKKIAQDRAKYSAEQLREAEELYQVANQKWGSAEAACRR